MNQQRDLRISEQLCAAAEQKFGQQFKDVEELLEFILRDLLRDESGEMDQAEQKIIEEKIWSDSIINSLPGIFYLFDINQNFLRWNQSGLATRPRVLHGNV